MVSFPIWILDSWRRCWETCSASWYLWYGFKSFFSLLHYQVEYTIVQLKHPGLKTTVQQNTFHVTFCTCMWRVWSFWEFWELWDIFNRTLMFSLIFFYIFFKPLRAHFKHCSEWDQSPCTAPKWCKHTGRHVFTDMSWPSQWGILCWHKRVKSGYFASQKGTFELDHAGGRERMTGVWNEDGKGAFRGSGERNRKLIWLACRVGSVAAMCG